MKKLILIILFFASGFLYAQNTNVSKQSDSNSSTALIDSCGTFTGTWELMRGYNSVSLTIYADSASSTNGVQVQFSANKTDIDYYFKTSYTAGDTAFSRTVPVLGMYMRVLFTTDAVDTVANVRIVTTLHQGNRPNITTDGDWKVYDATVEATLTNIESDIDTININTDQLLLDADTLIDNTNSMLLDNDQFLLDNDTLIDGSIQNLLDNDTLIDNSASNLLDNDQFLLDNDTLIDNSASNLLDNDQFLLDNDTLIDNSASNLLDNDQFLLDNDTLIDNSASALLDNDQFLLDNDTLIDRSTDIDNNTDGLEGSLDSVKADIATIKGYLNDLEDNTLIDSLYGVFTLTSDSTAYQFSVLVADTLSINSVLFTNYTSGAVIHFGTNNSVTIDNGAQPTPYTWDAIRYADSTTDIWLCSTANTTKVRYTIRIRR